jgi:hypothetical protein
MSDIVLGVAGGTGCALPGIDTGVLSEHPAGTCYDSLNFTWDDTTNRQILQAGIGNTISSGTSMNDGYIFGPSNSVTGVAFGTTQVRVFGDNNTVGPTLVTTENHIFGFSNIVNHVGDSWTIGSNNYTEDVGSDVFNIGNHNIVHGSSAGVASNGRDCFVIGEDQLLTAQSGSPETIDDCVLLGFNNQIIGNNTLSVAISGSALIGEENQIFDDSGSVISNVHILGSFNVVRNDLNAIDQSDIVGSENLVDGASSTIQILGFDNTGYNVTPALTGDAFIVGAENNMTAAPFNNLTYGGVFGAKIVEQNCSDCFAVGENVVSITNNSVVIGVEGAPELTVTPGNVKRTPIGLTNGPVINAVWTSGGSVTGAAGQTCNLSFTGGTGSGGTGVVHIVFVNSAQRGGISISAGGSYTGAPTGGTLTNGTATCSGSIVLTSTLGLAPSCSSATEGSYSAFIDSTTTTWGATITGGGANHVLAYCDGTNWTVAGK